MLAFTYLHFLLLSISWLLSVLHLLSWIGLYLVRTEALLDRLIFVLDAAGAWGTKRKNAIVMCVPMFTKYIFPDDYGMTMGCLLHKQILESFFGKVFKEVRT